MNKFFILIGPSGSGKDSLRHAVSQKDDTLRFVTTCVTRQPRPGERDGIDYHFLSKEEFHAGIEAGEFLEYDAHYDHFYGTKMVDLQNEFNRGCDAITDLNWPGVVQVLQKLGDQAVPILIMPPSFATLAERLQKRTAEGGRPLSAERLDKIQQDFLHLNNPDYIFTNPDMIGAKMSDFKAVITNDTLETAVNQLHKVIVSYR